MSKMFSNNFKAKEIKVRESIIHRKYEYETFFSSHLKDIITEQNIKEEVFDGNEIECESGYYNFDNNEYNLVTFNELSFGNDEASDEWEFVKIENVKFYYCNFSTCCFSNIKFNNCLFIGCTFKECYTMDYGVVYEECSFLRNDARKKNVDDMFSMFSECELTARFYKCDMSQNIFEKTNFYFSRFEDNNMFDLIFADCGFDITILSDCNLRNANIINTKFIDFSIEDTFKGSKVNRNTFFGELSFNKKEKREVRFAIETYIAFNELFQNNKISNLSGEYFYLFKKTELVTLHGFSRLGSIISYLICGYGERPFYSLIVSFLLVFTCGNLYFFLGLSTSNGVLIFNPVTTKLIPSLNDLIQCYHFSLVTFSTVGYGNVIPIGGSIVVNEFEMVLAIILVGIWVSTLVRKMVR